jgi:hypothetical protein
MAIEVRASVILPAAFASATSSKGFNSSKNFSTSAALLVSKPKSINSAANDTTPSGTFIKPDAKPAAADVYQDVLLFSSA